MEGNIYRIFLKQNIGNKNIAKVAKNDEVLKGTLIGTWEKEGISSDVHSSIAGKVIQVTDDFVDIESFPSNDDSFVKIQGRNNLEIIKNAGIVGMGGAGFPTYMKLSQKLQPNGILIINAAECEPILSHNIKRLEEDCDSIIKGAMYAAETVGACKIVIAIKEKHSKAIEKLNKSIGGKNIELHFLKDLYPMGEERAVIREVTGNLLSVNDLPFKANAVVINVETALRIHEAIDYGKPVITKDLTVAGEINSEDKIHVMFDVPIGTKVKNILDQFGGVKEEYGEITLGGPFTGKRGSIDSYVTKNVGGIIATMPYFKDKRKVGLLVCACGADKARLEEIAESMGSEVVAYEYCKQAMEVRGTYKCANPGKCPGQAQKVMNLKKNGAEILLISNCSDCSNTVMTIAPKMKIPVYHSTDAALRSVGMKLVRKLSI